MSLVLFYISTKYHNNIPKGLWLTEWTQNQWIITVKYNFLIDWLSWGLTTRQPLWVILCRLPEKGRKETEEIAEEMKERDREERGTGMKVKKQKK